MYFEGTAQMISVESVDDQVYELFARRQALGPEIIEDAKQADGHKFYKLTVRDMYLFDSRESNPSQKYKLKR